MSKGWVIPGWKGTLRSPGWRGAGEDPFSSLRGTGGQGLEACTCIPNATEARWRLVSR